MPAPNEPAFIVNSRLSADDCSYKAASTPSADSRSTSPGSSSLPSPSSGPLPAPCNEEGLPTYDYPAPFFVRNAFIEAGVPRTLSLEEFLEERRVHSCPVESSPGLGYEDSAATLPRGPSPLTTTGGAVNSALAAAASASAAVAAATRCLMRGRVSRDSPSPGVQQPIFNLPTQIPSHPDGCIRGFTPSPSSPVVQQPTFNLWLSDEVSRRSTIPSSPPLWPQPPILRLADAIAEHSPDLAEMPTLGPASHILGNCRPCAFYYTKGCGNGTQCSFCHICPPGEKKRRQKDKAVLCREMKRMGLMPEA